MEHIQIGVDCSPKEIQVYTALFKELHDIFSSSYEEMLAINPHILIHEIQTYPRARPVRQ